MRIYTRTGDGGETSLFDGSRVHKDDARIEAYGTIDELNAVVGVLLDHATLASQQEEFRNIQDHLFRIGGMFADPNGPREGQPMVDASDVEGLEHWIDGMEKDLPPLRHFVLPGGSPAVSACHVARTVCRRAERRAVALDRLVVQSADAMRYLNRLSDAFFTLGRWAAHSEGTVEEKWPRDTNPSS
jgi:cob(I)alamin adenosyltransferase